MTVPQIVHDSVSAFFILPFFSIPTHKEMNCVWGGNSWTHPLRFAATILAFHQLFLHRSVAVHYQCSLRWAEIDKSNIEI